MGLEFRIVTLLNHKHAEVNHPRQSQHESGLRAGLARYDSGDVLECKKKSPGGKYQRDDGPYHGETS